MSLICTGAEPMCAEGGAMVTEAMWLAANGRSKGTGGTESARFTFTGVEVILARLWRWRKVPRKRRASYGASRVTGEKKGPNE